MFLQMWDYGATTLATNTNLNVKSVKREFWLQLLTRFSSSKIFRSTCPSKRDHDGEIKHVSFNNLGVLLPFVPLTDRGDGST